MFRLLPKVIGTTVILTLHAMRLMAGSLLTNPGFESDPAGETQTILGWTQYGGNNYSETSSGTPFAAHGGTNYFKVYQAFNGVVNYTGIYQDYISGPGAVYWADGWAFANSADQLAGQNSAWIEVTFRDANANILAQYKSALITTNALAKSAFPLNAWRDLPVTNQYSLSSGTVTNTVAQLVAPAGTYFVRYQVVFQGDANGSAGSVYFDDLNLVTAGGAPYGNWNIVWSDEFNGTNVNGNVWTYDLGNGGSNPGWGNNELEYYTSRTNNAYVAGGRLHIAARQESTNGFSYTSARMKTQGLFAGRFGRFEWRAQLPAGAGFWPALWMLGTNIANIGWPACGEIDVMENNGGAPGTVQGSLHSGSDETGSSSCPAGSSVPSFHSSTVDWSTNALLFYVDGHLYESQTSWSSSSGAYPFPFNQPFFIILNLAVGGNYLGNPSPATINANSTFPAEMLVDYVRLYNATAPLKLSVARASRTLLVSWPSNVVAHLQLNPAVGGTNWSDLPGSTNPASLNPTNGSGFYRLLSP